MKTDTKIWLTFSGFVSLLALLPFPHEALHYIPAYFFGMNPVFDFSNPQRFLVWYLTTSPGPYWDIQYAITTHLPEIVMLSVALGLTYYFRRNGYGLVLTFPLVMMSVWGWFGHLGWF